MALTDKESKILYSIRVGSENDPSKPEFPPDKPAFQSTPIFQIKVTGFTNIWLKDESKNPTGTHKDRMAWELVVTYREMLLAKKNSQLKERLPQMSIITSGSAGIAVGETILKTTIKAYIKEIDKKEMVAQLGYHENEEREI